MTVEIICADAREALAAMPEGSVQMSVTSPPYFHARNYRGLSPLVWGGDVGCEHEWRGGRYRRRSNDAKPGQMQRTNTGSVGRDIPTVHATCQRCEAWRGSLGSERTPALYVNHVVEALRPLRRVLRDDGTLWLNLGFQWDGRGNCIDTPHMVRDGLVRDGWFFKMPIIWDKPNVFPESVTKRPTIAHEMLFLIAKHPKTGYYFEQDAIREPHKPDSHNQDPNANPERQAYEGIKAKEYAENGGRPHRVMGMRGWAEGRRNKRSVWTVLVQPTSLRHFAAFPEKLVEPCILAGCPEGGTVLDPFAGSGTVGLVAERLGRHSVLIDASEDYCRMARERTAQMGLMEAAR